MRAGVPVPWHPPLSRVIETPVAAVKLVLDDRKPRSSRTKMPVLRYKARDDSVILLAPASCSSSG